jgi:hypothetical protein
MPIFIVFVLLIAADGVGVSEITEVGDAAGLSEITEVGATDATIVTFSDAAGSGVGAVSTGSDKPATSLASFGFSGATVAEALPRSTLVVEISTVEIDSMSFELPDPSVTGTSFKRTNLLEDASGSFSAPEPSSTNERNSLKFFISIPPRLWNRNRVSAAYLCITEVVTDALG